MILIPYFVRIFDEKSNALIYIAIIVCYFLYSYLLMPVDSSVLPYRTIFPGNGHWRFIWKHPRSVY